MSKTPRQRAEACFAVARSTAHAGERSAAISRGEFICKRYGLDLNDFDIPGRVRKIKIGGMTPDGFDLDLDLVAEAFRRAGPSPYSPFYEFGTVNRPRRPSPPNRCPGCGVVILFGTSCTSCARK